MSEFLLKAYDAAISALETPELKEVKNGLQALVKDEAKAVEDLIKQQSQALDNKAKTLTGVATSVREIEGADPKKIREMDARLTRGATDETAYQGPSTTPGEST